MFYLMLNLEDRSILKYVLGKLSVLLLQAQRPKSVINTQLHKRLMNNIYFQATLPCYI